MVIFSLSPNAPADRLQRAAENENRIPTLERRESVSRRIDLRARSRSQHPLSLHGRQDRLRFRQQPITNHRAVVKIDCSAKSKGL